MEAMIDFSFVPRISVNHKPSISVIVCTLINNVVISRNFVFLSKKGNCALLFSKRCFNNTIVAIKHTKGVNSPLSLQIQINQGEVYDKSISLFMNVDNMQSFHIL
jgi:hypothetical protein